MKIISRIILAVAASAMIFVSCDQQPDSLGTEISVSFPDGKEALDVFAQENATAQTVTVNADGEWIAVTPEGVTVEPNTGVGSTAVSINVEDNIIVSEIYKIDLDKIKALYQLKGENPVVETNLNYSETQDPDSLIYYVTHIGAPKQMSVTFCVADKSVSVDVSQNGDENVKTDPEKLTVKQFCAKPDNPSVYYELTGTVTNITSMEYGNFDLVDETGSVYVYGLLPEKGSSDKKNFASLNITDGDKLTLHGTRGSFGDKIEVMNAYYVSHEKASLVKILSDNPVSLEAQKGEFTVELKVTGSDGWTYAIAEDCDWITFKSTKTQDDVTYVTFSYTSYPKPEETRTSSISFSSFSGATVSAEVLEVAQTGAELVSPIEEVIAAEAGSEFIVQGTVVACYLRGFLVQDETGTLLCYWGSGVEEGKYSIGDVVKVEGELDFFNCGAQCQNPVVTVVTEGEGFEYPEAKIYDGAALDEALSLENVLPEYVAITGKLTVSGDYCNLIVDGAETAQGSLSYPLSSLNLSNYKDKTVTVYGYFFSISKSGGAPKYINLMVTSVEE